ncbi:MAG: heavy metal translocating P-type ATPase [Alphaproteobacteria bacterium]
MEPATIPAAQTDTRSLTAYGEFAQTNEAGNHTLTFHVKGIHCASCIQLIENALQAEPDVVEARVNMTTGRLTLVWQGKKDRADALAEIVEKLGYHLKPYMAEDAKAPDSQEKFLLRCIAVSGFAAGNMMLLSVALWSSSTETMGISTRSLFHWVSALIALPTIFYAGRPFFRSAYAVLKQGHTNMDVPISLAVLLASGMSISEALRHGEHVYFDSAVMLLFFLLIGRYLDARAKGKARETAKDLLSMLAGTATQLTKCGHTKTIPIRDVREGMTLLVASGENIPADGVITEGESDIDMSLISGETLPQHITTGSRVFAGTSNMTAPLTLTVSKASEDSLLSDIVRLMEKAEQGQARYVRLAEKAARLYTPVVHTLGALTFFGWWLGMNADWQVALLHGVTVLIITCPCALGLAVPVVQVLASSKLMKRGILLKSGDALEKLAEIHVAVFDKTGTLTLGKPELQGQQDREQLKLAASLAHYSKHPLSQAICRAYEGALVSLQHIEELPGKGLQAKWNGRTIRLGSRNWCGDTQAAPHGTLELWLAIEGQHPVQFTFSDRLRADTAKTIEKLKQAGILCILLSGDRHETVLAVADAIGISEYQAHLTPMQKTEYIKRQQTQGYRVLMVGDGLNDAPSLATADISMSPSTAIDISQNTADIVFQGNMLTPVYDAWQVAGDSNRLVKQNFMLAVMYNIVAIPLAVMGYVTPMIAALAMSGSSLLVIANSFRLHIKQNP